MRRLRPDILEKRLKTLERMNEQRKDIQAIDENDDRTVVPAILKEQGLMEEGQSTIVYDRVAHLGQTSQARKESLVENEEVKAQLKKMDLVLSELKQLKEQVHSSGQINTQKLE